MLFNKSRKPTIILYQLVYPVNKLFYKHFNWVGLWHFWSLDYVFFLPLYFCVLYFRLNLPWAIYTSTCVVLLKK